ncbi:MAG TPA: RNA polymerase sigma factor [Pyrinomonadaceae bacterium]|nr:RNA polymerase sigma factor [Pyrinomonadaceae bacterium]
MPENYHDLSDLELVNSSLAGDEMAFAEIVRRFSPRVFRFAGRFFRQPAQVEEIAQDVFLKAFTQLKKFEGRGSLEGWLTRITVNTCLNALRHGRYNAEQTFADLSDDEGSWLEEKLLEASAGKQLSAEDNLIATDLVDRTLAILPPDVRLVLVMIDGEGYSIKDAAAASGWSESKVKVTVFRYRRKLRERLEKLLNKDGVER